MNKNTNRRKSSKTDISSLLSKVIFASGYSFCYDLSTFNNNEFENDYNDIYPDEMEL